MRQLSNFYVSKDTIKKVKRRLTKWEKIFSSHVSYEESYAEYTRTLTSLTVKGQIAQLNMGKG